MAYDQMDAPEGNEPVSENESKDNTWDLPADWDGIENLKAGDTITLRIVEKYKEGGACVEVVSEPKAGEEKPFFEDMRDTMAGNGPMTED